MGAGTRVPAQAVPAEVTEELAKIDAIRAKRDPGNPTRLVVVPSEDVHAGVAEAVANAFNLPVYFLRNELGAMPFNGVTWNKRIYVAADSTTPALAVAVHEVGHNLPADIRKRMVDAIMETVSPAQEKSFFELLPGYQDLPRHLQREEIAMRIIEQDSQNPGFWLALQRKLGMTDFGKLVNSILGTLDKIISGFSKYDSSQFTTDIKKVREAVADAYAAALAQDEYNARTQGGKKSLLKPLMSAKPVEAQTDTAAFKAWSGNAPLVTSAQAEQYNFQTGKPVVVEAFHGTARPDRVGTVMQRKRATSGPMAFHTSSPMLASSYALGKQDTSLANEDQSYQNWFKYKPKGQRSPVPIDRAWYSLPSDVKEKVAERMPDIRMDDDGNVIYEKGGGDLGSYDWNLKQTQRSYDKRGNPLAAAVETWLNSGSIFNSEEDFMQVLKLAGVPINDVTFDSPNSSYPFVYKNYIAMRQPLVTSDIPGDVILALQDAAKRDRSRAQPTSDMWDKNGRTLREWVKELTEPANGSAKYVWTSIPDKVTEVFKSLGYDGIIDWSGKSGGTEHPVYIPFEETQVKSALGNKGKFDRSKKDIRFSETQPKPAGAEVNPANANARKALDELVTMARYFGINIEQPSKAMPLVSALMDVSQSLGTNEQVRQLSEDKKQRLRDLYNQAEEAATAMRRVEERVSHVVKGYDGSTFQKTHGDPLKKAQKLIDARNKAGELDEKQWLAESNKAAERFLDDVAIRFGDKEVAERMFKAISYSTNRKNKALGPNLRYFLDDRIDLSIKTGPNTQNFTGLLKMFARAYDLNFDSEYLDRFSPEAQEAAKKMLKAFAGAIGYKIQQPRQGLALLGDNSQPKTYTPLLQRIAASTESRS